MIKSLLLLGLLCAACDTTPSDSFPCDEAVSPPSGPVGVWEFLGLEGENILAIAVDPCDPNTILTGSSTDFSLGRRGKLFRSRNGGKAWDTLRVGESYSQILFDPSDPRIAYASTFPTQGWASHAVLKSTDGAGRWVSVIEGLKLDSYTGIPALAIDPQDHRVLYAGTAGRFGGWLYLSENGGEEWVPVPETAGNEPLANGITAITVDPNDHHIIYGGTAISGHLLKSIDRGRHWKLTGLRYTGGLVEDMLVMPGNSNAVFAAVSMGGVYRSQDGGETWVGINSGLPDSTGAKALVQGYSHTDIYVFAFDLEEGGWVYAWDERKAKWSKLGTNQLHDPQSYGTVDLFFDENSRTLYFGTNGLYRYRVR